VLLDHDDGTVAECDAEAVEIAEEQRGSCFWSPRSFPTEQDHGWFASVPGRKQRTEVGIRASWAARSRTMASRRC
jgi:hypothetical protein